MVNRLEQDELRAVEGAVLGAHGDDLLELLCALSLGEPTPSVSPVALDLATDLGWLARAPQANPRLTPLGWKMSDPAREYCLWKWRDRRLHFERECPALERASFRGKTVLDLGCGAGCNSFSIDAHAASIVGLDLEPLYLQLAGILACREAVRRPPLLLGRAEALPLAGDTFDVVLAANSLQYVDAGITLGEVNRVLKVGGRLICTQSTLGAFLFESLRTLPRRGEWNRMLQSVLAVLDTVSYQLVGRRMRVNRSGFTTKLPVYPSSRWIRKALRRAGFRLDERETRRVGHETCLVAEKAGPIMFAAR